MIGTHEIIGGDLFNISNRVREIDEGYFIAFNYRTKKFEVHNNNQRGNSLCLVSPFKTLDCRLLAHLRITRVERREQLIKDMEKSNLMLEKERIENEKKKAELHFENALKKG